jgi:hypothetical protein
MRNLGRGEIFEWNQNPEATGGELRPTAVAGRLLPGQKIYGCPRTCGILKAKIFCREGKERRML